MIRWWAQKPGPGTWSAASTALAVIVVGAGLFGGAARAGDGSAGDGPSTEAGGAASATVDLGDEVTLMRLVWERSPEVAFARGEVAIMHAEVVRARLLANPELDLELGSLPLAGAPDEVQTPWTQGPSVSLGLGWTVEVGKRHARTRLARAGVDLAGASAQALAYERFFEVLGVLSRLALAELEAELFKELVTESEALLQLQRKRLQAGDIPATEVSRAELEHARLLAQQGTALSEQHEALGQCAQLLGLRCPTFGDQARAWVERMLATPLPASWEEAIAERHPELLELTRREEVARALSGLAEAEALPDIGLRVGYTWDTFPGNHGHTASLGVSVPLMVSRRGQAEAAQAQAELVRVQAMRAARRATATHAIEMAQRRLDLVRSRRGDMQRAMAQGDALIDAMVAALARGGGNLADLLMARRSRQEVALEALAIEALAIDAVLDARREAGLAPALTHTP